MFYNIRPGNRSRMSAGYDLWCPETMWASKCPHAAPPTAPRLALNPQEISPPYMGYSWKLETLYVQWRECSPKKFWPPGAWFPMERSLTTVGFCVNSVDRRHTVWARIRQSEKKFGLQGKDSGWMRTKIN